MQNKKNRIPAVYAALLSGVDRPGRYVGGEVNSVVKDASLLDASIALAFPDVYDLGMSYHGFRILYERVNARDNFAAERVYTPWPDYAQALRDAGLPLASLESFRPLRDFEIVGFTLQHELGYTNVLETLDLAGIPLHAADRVAPFPLVIAGGEGAYSPEPLADFIDAFVLGDGEEIALELLELAGRARKEAWDRPALLRSLAALEGVYVPALYEARWAEDGTSLPVRPLAEGVPAVVRPRLFDISRDLGPVRPVTPLIRTVQDRTVVEIRRGCVHGCRFCHAGMITRPVRERSIEQIVEAARLALEETGDSALSLLSLSSADHSEIRGLLRRLNAEFAERGVSVSLPSLRISSFDVELAQEVATVRKSGFTFAPEAGSDRLRRVINKPLDEQAFLEIIDEVLDAGWRTLKFYFMIGLPSETDEDLEGIVQITRKALVRAVKRGIKGMKVNVTLSPFTPKPHTPFQWEGQASQAELRRKLHLVRDRMPRNVAIKTSPLESSLLEAALARGDRRLGRVIETAWRKGCRFDGWSESFLPNAWWDAFEECGLDPAWYAERARRDDEIFPYEHIQSPPGRRFLELQRDAARRGETTPDCVENPCSGCDACAKPKAHTLARDAAVPETPQPGEQKTADRPAPHPMREDAERPVLRARLRFTKEGALRHVSHLDLAEAIHRLIRRSGAPVAHSQGFNPQPRISISPPLPLGFAAKGELADVLLLERLDLLTWLRRLRSLPAPDGLEWLGVEEIGLREDSLQQAITHFDYELRWRRLPELRQVDGKDADKTGAACKANEEDDESAHGLPCDTAALESLLKPFLDSREWPIEMERKGKTQERDARHFVKSCEILPEDETGRIGLRLTMLSDNGTTLNPLLILENLLGSAPGEGLHLEVVRLPIQVGE
jgi:radical SAM family uncharacterized protein/radical SAM-linked protein